MHINGIDEKDNEIINLLLENARMSYSDIGSKIGLSRTAVKNRISALEKSGIISGYCAIVDPQKSTETITLIINIETSPETFEEAKKTLSEMPETTTVIQTTGKCRLVVISVAKDLQTAKAFVNRVYKDIDGIVSVNASAVLDVIKGSIIFK